MMITLLGRYLWTSQRRSTAFLTDYMYFLRSFVLIKFPIPLFHFLTNRKQCVKIGNTKSNSLKMTKGVPQGSLTGPVLFNVFINDIFYFISGTKLFNYADDNTITCSNPDYNVMKATLEAEGEILVDWFTDNQMEANPGKFHHLIYTMTAFLFHRIFQYKGNNVVK